MPARYCYWSVATGHYAPLMELCARSARRCGVFREFHVFTDRQIEGCECYDAHQVDTKQEMFQLVYLTAGISRLLYDWFVWLDADTCFVRNPRNVLSCLQRSPIHVPLTSCLSGSQHAHETEDFHANVSWPEAADNTKDTAQASGLRQTSAAPPGAGHAAGEGGRSRTPIVREYVELMREAGVCNAVFGFSTAFWIVHREAIDRIVELASFFRLKGKERGLPVVPCACLGYAMQMLCADPRAHVFARCPDLWASDSLVASRGAGPDGPWEAAEPLTGERFLVNPAIIHVPHSKPWGAGRHLSCLGCP